MSITLEIQDDFAAHLQTRREEAEARLRLELAVALYRRGDLPSGCAADVAAVSLPEFEALLRQRGVPVPYSLEDLERDVAYARSGG